MSVGFLLFLYRPRFYIHQIEDPTKNNDNIIKWDNANTNFNFQFTHGYDNKRDSSNINMIAKYYKWHESDFCVVKKKI